jgi:hypothetical protein
MALPYDAQQVLRQEGTRVQTKPGLKLRGATCPTEIVVVRPAAGDVELACCGQPMIEPDGSEPPAAAPSPAGILLGKRYADETSGLEVLCTKPGPGPLTVDGRELQVKGPKPLPASD